MAATMQRRCLRRPPPAAMRLFARSSRLHLSAHALNARPGPARERSCTRGLVLKAGRGPPGTHGPGSHGDRGRARAGDVEGTGNPSSRAWFADGSARAWRGGVPRTEQKYGSRGGIWGRVRVRPRGLRPGPRRAISRAMGNDMVFVNGVPVQAISTGSRTRTRRSRRSRASTTRLLPIPLRAGAKRGCSSAATGDA